ncbi:nitroreductase family protein [Sinomonas mesophila]|uniref:nitroreductase family protein n=1 Tax=Sinomonas mesophila TaxID=1531955 RepID=UPI000987929D|nr:nitroreductase family protein [Sinomonas mesophila]
MKATLKRLLPENLLNILRFARSRAAKGIDYPREFAQDLARYIRHSGPDDQGVRASSHFKHIEMQLTKDYHRVEKGLALAAPRRPFGNALMDRLELLVPAAELTPTGRGEYVAHARDALSALKKWNSGGDVTDLVSPEVEVDRPHIPAEEFFKSRHSIRNFSHKPVDQAVFHEAVELALHSPSVCNRQPWKIRFYNTPEAVRQALSFQNGNSGFGQTTPAAALITVDLRLFAGAGERNQAWIEGGIFSMSLVWALHALGIDSCMLNMSLPNKKISNLRRDLNVEDNELVVMFIAMGYGAAGRRRARSPRRGIDEVAL